MTTTSEAWARNFARTLDALASGDNDFQSSQWIASARNALNGAAALLRELASNQLPDFDSIQPATPEPHAAEIVEAWSQRCSAQYTGATAAARLSVAAAWIKARDQEIGNLRAARAREIPPPQAFERDPASLQGFSAWRKLGEYLDARKLGGAVKCDGDHGGPPCSDPECWARDSSSDLQSQLAPLLALFKQQSEAQAQHWRALEFQTRRIADASALRALSVADKLETLEGDALLMRVRSDALK